MATSIPSTNQILSRNLKILSLGHWNSPLCETSTWLKFSRILRWLASHSNCCEYALEFRAFLRRMLLLRKAQKAETPFRQLLVEFGPYFVQDELGRLWKCTATPARISDTQTFESNHPWATPIDAAIFLEGWDAGVRWALRNLYSEEADKQS